MSKIIGIDFGTTNCRVAVMEGGEPVVIACADGNRAMPSAVSLTGDGGRLTGRDAVRQAVISADRTVLSVKRSLGTAKTVSAGGKAYYPQHICAMILEKAKETAEFYLGEKVSQAVISVPACFSNRQRRAVMDAGRIAGLEVLRLISEPSAAALAYGLSREEHGKILVYGLGGGAFNVSIVEIGDGMFEVLAAGGSPALGGDDFDQRIAGYAAEQFRSQCGIDLKQDVTAARRLKEAAENARIELSSVTAANISLPFIAADADGPKHLDVTLTRAKFNELTVDLVEKTMELTRRVLKDAGLRADEIDRVVLAGGCTRIPAVQDAVRKLTGREPSGGVNPDECVAVGAAIQGGVVSGEVDGVLLLDVTPMSFGLETEGNVFTKLIDRNTSLPVIRTQVFSTAKDGQTTVEIHVLEGEQPTAGDNISLGRFRLTGIAPAPRGVPQIEVAFDIDCSGRLNVSAADKATGRKYPVALTESAGLSETEIAQCAAEEKTYREKRAKLREDSETLNQADDLLRQAEKLLRETGGRLSAEDRNMLRAETDAFRKIRESGSAAGIRSGMESFTQKVYAVLSRPNQPRAEQKEDPAAPPVDGPTDAAVRMLPVLDDLERAVLAASGSDRDLKAGIGQICKKMRDIYRELGFTEINRPGEMFDPNLEHAVGLESSVPGKPGTVYRVVRKGYMAGGKVVRYAQVTVIGEKLSASD